MKYSISQVVLPGFRCTWCWEELPDRESHYLIEAAGGRPLSLRMHVNCWPQYRAVSGVELHSSGVQKQKWTPARIEELRIRTEMKVDAFASAIGVSEQNFLHIMSGDPGALNTGTLSRLRTLATQYRVSLDKSIDWSNPCAVFCLRMVAGLSQHELAKKLGLSKHAIRGYELSGVPYRSVRAWGRLTSFARSVKFDAGSVSPDRLWTREFLAAAVENSGQSPTAWGAAGRCSAQAVQNWMYAKRGITRESAWRLTLAASVLGAAMPPEAKISGDGDQGVRRKLISGEESARQVMPQFSRWTIDAIRRLGTAPDRVIAEQLHATKNQIAIMRRAIGIPAVDFRSWDHVIRSQIASDDELKRRWRTYREAVKIKARALREEHMKTQN